jgi:hypothetical protein
MNGQQIEANGKAYRLIYTTNALCQLEQHLGVDVAEALSGLANRGSISLIKARALFWAALIEHHPSTTIDDAGKIMDRIGLAAATALIPKIIEQAFPASPASGSAGGAPGPFASAPDGIGTG